MRNPCWLLALVLLTLVPACDDTDRILRPPTPPGALTYTGYDDRGATVVVGWVELDIAIITTNPPTPVNITGRWELRRVGTGGSIGPQVGQGDLVGLLQADTLSVNFNPQQADDNVFADGELKLIGNPPSGLSWEGSWTWSTLTGPRSSGTFRARS